MTKEVYLVDGSAYIYRAYHGVAPLSNSNGLATHAVFGFINIIKRLIRERNPHYLVVAFDSRGKVFRHEIYGDYKANRPPMPDDLSVQIPFIKQFVEFSNIPAFICEGVEADDIIATATQLLSRQGCKVTIVSGDKDLLQLVNDDVSMWDPMKKKTMDPQGIEKKYGVTPGQLLDYYALIGDSSDNVPGVPGVGPKTAQKLINDYSTLDGVFDNVEAMKKSKLKERLQENREKAYLSKELIALKMDVDIPGDLSAYTVGVADDAQLQELFKELEFKSLISEGAQAKKVDTAHFHLVQTEAELEALAAALAEAKIVAIDTETSSLVAHTASLVGVSLCVDLNQAWYVPLAHLDEEKGPVDGQLPDARVREVLGPYLTSPTLVKVGHNLKYDYTVLAQQWDIELAGPLLDTMIAAYLLEPTRRSYKLDDLCLEIDIEMTPFTAVVDNPKRENCFAFVDLETAGNYSCEDVYGTLSLWQLYEPQLAENGLNALFFEVEMPLVPILARMETRGILVDPDMLQSLSLEFTAAMAELETEIYGLAGEEFNINSPKQLGEILFEKLELPHGRKTKTGYSTDMKVLEKLSGVHPLPAQVTAYRTLAKLQSTYVEKLAALIDPATGRVHTSFNQTVTATGRLSSSNPNLQNIPIRTDEGNRIRQAFVAPAETLFLSADYSQIDLRVLAHFSQDEALLHAFNNGEDIHAQTAAEIFGISKMLITPEMRRVAKSINFGIVYGMSAFGLASQLGITRKEAQTFIGRYFAHYDGVKRFMEDVIEKAREDGFVVTLLGRRRDVPDLHLKNKTRREFAERIALNTPIQGTAADIIKLAMIHVEKALVERQLSATLLLQIHDELVLEVPQQEREATQLCVQQAMEGAFALDVPLVVNCQTGTHLGKE